MLQQHDNLIKIGSTMSETQFNIIIMSSLPESYCPTLQTITAMERAKLSGLQSNAMEVDDLIALIIEEAQHCVINDDHTKSAESALAACTKKPVTLWDPWGLFFIHLTHESGIVMTYKQKEDNVRGHSVKLSMC